MKIVYPIAAVLTVAAIGWAAVFDTGESEPLPPALSPYDKHIIEMDREALDEAYRGQVMHLFATWMRDATGQPGRAIVGVANARLAYIEAMKAIERREKELPP